MSIAPYPESAGELQFCPAPPGTTVRDRTHDQVLILTGWWQSAAGRRIFAAVLRPSILEATRVDVL